MIQYIKDIRQASGGDLPHSKKDAMIAISNILTSEQSDADKIDALKDLKQKFKTIHYRGKWRSLSKCTCIRVF